MGATMTRIRKAWQATVHAFNGYHIDYVYAPTRSKAMGQVYRNFSDAWDDFTFKDALKHTRLVRAAWRDEVIPDRHPLTPQLHPDILHCVVHAYGGKGLKAGYRDHFYTDARDWRLRCAFYHGLFDRYRVDPRRAGGDRDMVMYELTTLGKNVARGEAEVYPRGY